MLLRLVWLLAQIPRRCSWRTSAGQIHRGYLFRTFRRKPPLGLSPCPFDVVSTLPTGVGGSSARRACVRSRVERDESRGEGPDEGGGAQTAREG